MLLFELCLVLHWGAGCVCMYVCLCVYGGEGGYVCECGALPGASGGLWQYIY